MKMNRKIKRMAYIILPAIFTVVFLFMFHIGIKSMITVVKNEFSAVWIKGSPTYNFDNVDDLCNLPKSGIIHKGNIIFPKVGDMYGQISCDKIKLNAPLYYGDMEEILDKGVGTYIGKNVPGEGQTILTGAHDTTYFSNLENIKIGDIVHVTTTYGMFEYEVIDIKILDVTNSEAYNTNKDKEVLIMYTCYPFGKIETPRDERYYVYAEKISGPQIGGRIDE